MLGGLGNLFIPQPWLALIPGLVFAVLYRLSGRYLVGLAAIVAIRRILGRRRNQSE